MRPRDGIPAFETVEAKGSPASIGGGRRLTPRSGQALDAALTFLRAAVEAGGTVPSRVAFDPSFESSFRLSEARGRIRLRMGIDIGYDLGDDLWTAICGLPLLPAGEPELAESFARMVDQARVGRRYRFFLERNGFPADTDCTAVAGHALYERRLISPDDMVEIARELLLAAVPEGQGGDAGEGLGDALVHPGVPTVYWDDDVEPDAKARSRCHDPVVCANVLCALKTARRLGMRDADDVIDVTQRYVADHLLSGAYRGGSRYYPAPEAFLFAASRLAGSFPECRDPLREPIAEAIAERDAGPAVPGRDDDRHTALNVALRILSAHNIGAGDEQGLRLRALLRSQASDGSWPALPYFKLGRLPVYFGSRVLSTLFAAAAVRVSVAQGDGVDFS